MPKLNFYMSSFSHAVIIFNVSMYKSSIMCYSNDVSLDEAVPLLKFGVV